MSADKCNILIVDDLPEKLLVLESILDELGQNVIAARSGEEALRKVLDHDFAVILLDVNMPGMDGLETAALIRTRKKSAHTPIIFVTAFADEMHTLQGYSLGAVDYILAPVMPEILRTKIRVFVDLYRLNQEIMRQADERVALAAAQAARTVAESAHRRSLFLAEASKALASSLDFEVAVQAFLNLAVPYLADIGGITSADPHGHLTTTALAWRNQMGEPLTATLKADALPDSLAAALRGVLDSAKLVHLAQGGVDTALASAGQTQDARALELPICDIALQSVLLVPLPARERVLGVLLLATGPSGRRYDSAELQLAEELASRVAIAMENARLYRDIQRADQNKNDFLSMLAHELRNPLAPIRNAVHILRLRGSKDTESLAVHNMIDRQVHHLTRLVDDLLDVSRITRGKIRLQTELIDLAAVVARAVEICRPLLDTRKHNLSVTLPPESIYVNGDLVRLAQVVENLLNNAAKYTEEGGHVWLAVAAEHEEAVVTVRDTGVGIPADMLSSIFELFTQVERSLDRSHGGLGIGLTLVRQLVEMHGGRVQAFSSGAHQGSQFVVRLPVARPPKPAPLRAGAWSETTPQRDAIEPSGGRRRVMVVDDNKDAADSLALLLGLSGHEVHVFHNGPDAVTAANNLRPEIVLLDIGLPGMDGFEVARRLRARPYMTAALLVAVSGYSHEQYTIRSRQAGFDHHLIKPVDPEALSILFAQWSRTAQAHC